MYHGPREQVVPFFEQLGFCIPERKGVADFIQEICSEKDQEVLPDLEFVPVGYSSCAGLMISSKRRIESAFSSRVCVL